MYVLNFFWGGSFVFLFGDVIVGGSSTLNFLDNRTHKGRCARHSFSQGLIATHIYNLPEVLDHKNSSRFTILPFSVSDGEEVGRGDLICLDHGERENLCHVVIVVVIIIRTTGKARPAHLPLWSRVHTYSFHARV